MNIVAISGRVGKVQEPKTTPSGVKAVLFSLAINRKNKNGEQETDWFNCTTYGSTADFVEKYVKAGSCLEVVGSLQTRSWEKDGQKASMTLIMVDRVSFPPMNKQDKPDDMPFEM